MLVFWFGIGTPARSAIWRRKVVVGTSVHYIQATAEQTDEFHIENMAMEMKAQSPEIWDLLGILLSARKKKPEASRKDKSKYGSCEYYMHFFIVANLCLHMFCASLYGAVEDQVYVR